LNIALNRQTITTEAALEAVKASVAKAETLAIAINVEVVDRSGIPMAFLRMSDAFIHSIDIAKDKAYSAVSFGFPTSDWEAIFAEEKMLKEGMPNQKRLIVFGGGIPIRLESELIGGIGVSGGTAEQDIICAEAGIKAILEKIN
jgi:uncharacterized protein GlcG (DUF336 family)